MNPLSGLLPYLWHSLVHRAKLLAVCCLWLLVPNLFQGIVQAAGQPPSVKIVAPIDGAAVMNTNDLVIAVEAADPDGMVTKVALFRDGLFLAQSLSAPHQFTLINPAVGANLYTAVATDNDGNTVTSTPVKVFVDAPLPPYFPPSASLTAASTNLVLVAPASVSLTAAATVYRDGLDRFDFQAVYGLFPSPVVAGEGRLNPSTLVLSNLAVGHYVFTVVARDIYGGAATSTAVNVTVVSPPDLTVPLFQFTDLGVLGGEESSATAINQLGAVVGTSTVASHSEEQRAFLWQAGLFRGIPHLPGHTYGLGLNDLGQASGSLAQGGALSGAFVWMPAAGLVVLPSIGAQAEAFALNAQGTAVGWSGGPSVSQPVAWVFGGDPNQPPRVIALSPGRLGQARAINSSGQIGGFVSDAQFSPSRAVLWNNGQELDLGVDAALGGERSQALGINSAGQVVGQVSLAAPLIHGFMWDRGVTRRLMPLVGSSGWPVAINDQGWSVGSSKPDNNFLVPEHAMLWLGQIPFDLNALVTNLNGTTLLKASAVNNRGQIVGTAFIGGQRHACLLSPTTLGGDHVPPTVALANPVAGITVPTSEPVTLLASVVAGTDNVARVDFYVDHSVVATAHGSPYSATWVPDVEGEFCLRALAVDATGHAAASPAACLTVKTTHPPQPNEPPSVSVQLPAGALHYEGDSVPLLAAATDPDGAVTVVFFSSGTNTFGSVARPPYSLTWPKLAAGTYPIVATAFDDLGAARTSAPVTLTVRAVNPMAPAVALVGAGAADHEADIRQNLRRTELFSRVDILGSQPTAAQLAAYDAVLVHSQTVEPLPAGLGDLLANYVDAGRGLAVALYASDMSHPVLRGRLVQDGYLGWSNEQIGSHGHGVMLKDLPEHPILAAVDTFDGGLSAIYAHEMVLKPGTLQVASWATHHPLAVVREVGAGRIVGLNLNPVSGAVTGLGWNTNSDGARLLANSLIWASAAPSNRFFLTTSNTNHNAYMPGEPVVLTAAGVNLANGGVVRFYSDGNLLGSATNLPATFAWSNAPVGLHPLVATHTDATGRIVAAPGVSITVDSRQTVELLTPPAGAIFYLPTNILMQVTFTNLDSTVVQVDYYLDHTQRLAAVTSPPFSFDFKLLPTGTYAFSAVVIDALGSRKASAAHPVTIVNTALPHLTEWKGGAGDWPMPTNWTAGPPRPQDPAVINRGVARLGDGAASARNLTVGQTASARLIFEGGTLGVGKILLLGEQTGSTGDMQLKALARLTAQEFVLGLQGAGTVVQAGGSVVADQLILSGNVGGTGSYDLKDGDLTIGNEVIGGISVGHFVQRGGTHDVKVLGVGNRNKSWGTFELTGGRLVTGIAIVGAGGGNPDNLSTLLQTGGIHEVLEEMRVGVSGASGRLALSGGALHVANLILDDSWLDLLAEPSTNRFRVSGTATLDGLLRVQLPAGYVPLGGDAITLMTYGNRLGTFAGTNLPPATNGVVWMLEYQPNALVMRAMPPPEGIIVSPVRATPQEGLFQQTVTLSNHGTEPIQGLRIYFPGLPANWQLYNAAGAEQGVPFVEVDSLVPPSTSIQFTVQFLIPGETRPARQSYVVRLGSVADAGAPASPLQVEQTIRRPDEAFELRFASDLNWTYRIEYSNDMLNWQEVPQPVIATGGQTQWVDDGPPKTIRRPAAEQLRFYRIIRLP